MDRSLTALSLTFQRGGLFGSFWRRFVLLWLMALLAFLFLSYWARTSQYLEERIEPRLLALGERLEATLSYGQIYAEGLTGIAIHALRIRPKLCGASCPELFIDKVHIYPDLLGSIVFMGNLNAASMEIYGLQLRGSWSGEAAIGPWLKALHAKQQAKTAQAQGEESTSAWRSQISKQGLEIHFHELLLSVDDLASGQVELSASDLGLRLEPDLKLGQTLPLVQREALRLCYRSEKLLGPEALCLALSLPEGLTLDPSAPIPRLVASECSEQGMLAKIQAIEAQALRWTLSEEGYGLELDALQLSLKADAQPETQPKSQPDSPAGALRPKLRLDFQKLSLAYWRKEEVLRLSLTQPQAKGSLALALEGELKTGLWTADAAFQHWDAQALLEAYPALGGEALALSGRLTLAYLREADEVQAAMDLELLNLRFKHVLIAQESLSFQPIKLESALSYRRREGRLRWPLAQLELAGLKLESQGQCQACFDLKNSKLELSTQLSGLAEAFLPALPEALLPALQGYRLEGPYQIQLDLGWDAQELDNLALAFQIDLAKVRTLAFAEMSPFDDLKGANFSLPVRAATVPVQLSPKSSTWLSFKELPRALAYVLIASEDGKFFSHPGIDLRALRASLIANLKAGRLVRGGSTISQQVAKNLFLNHDKSFSRKLQEAFLTWQMEANLSKERIFELYINLAHWAKDLYGLREAARFYFQKPVGKLSLRESLFLASILPNPVYFGRQYLEGRLSETRYVKMLNIGRALLATGRLSPEDWQEAEALLKAHQISEAQPSPEALAWLESLKE